MSVTALGKLTCAAILAMGLSACVDVDIDVAVTGEGMARAEMTQTMSAELYQMVKLNAEQAKKADLPERNAFCADGKVTENSDGSATCLLTDEGRFADLVLGGMDNAIVFSPAGPGLERISLSLVEMKDGMGSDTLDAESAAMMEAFFAGRSITLTFSGAEITDTNMVLSDDKTTAEQSIAFIDLLRGKPDLPNAYYAVVRAP